MRNSYVAATRLKTFTVTMDGGLQIDVDGRKYDYDFKALGSNSFSLILDGKTFTIGVDDSSQASSADSSEPGSYLLQINSRQFSILVEDERTHALHKLFKSKTALAGTQVVRAPMPGLIARLEVEPGNEVANGTGLLVLEAMKMENEIRSPIKGKVLEIHVSKGKAVEKGEPLLTILGT